MPDVPKKPDDDRDRLGKGPLRGSVALDRNASGDSLPGADSDDDDHTPVPQVVPPEMTRGTRVRITASPVLANAINNTDVPLVIQRALNELRGIIGDVVRTMDTYRESLHDVQRGLDKLWGVRNAAGWLAQIAKELGVLKASVDLMGPDASTMSTAIADLQCTVADLQTAVETTARESTEQIADLNRHVWGDKGREPDDKPLAVHAKRGSRLVQWLIAASLAGMGTAGVFLYQALDSAADMRAKVRYLETRSAVQDQQLLLLINRIVMPGDSP